MCVGMCSFLSGILKCACLYVLPCMLYLPFIYENAVIATCICGWLLIQYYYYITGIYSTIQIRISFANV